MKIDILDPKAIKLLENLADLKLIVIREKSESEFSRLLEKLRSEEASKLTLEEITKEVESVRSERYGKRSG